MKLIIRVTEIGKKPRVLETSVSDQLTLAGMRELLEVEQRLNNVPGSRLRFHINIVEE